MKKITYSGTRQGFEADGQVTCHTYYTWSFQQDYVNHLEDQLQLIGLEMPPLESFHQQACSLKLRKFQLCPLLPILSHEHYYNHHHNPSVMIMSYWDATPM